MSGEKKSNQDRLADFERVLNEYTDTLGFATIRYNTDVDQILELSRAQLRGMSTEDCGESAFILAQYAVFIQKEQNRQKVRIDWAERELSDIISREASNYGFGGDKGRYVKYDMIRSTVVSGNGAAKALNNIIRHAKARSLELDQISMNINIMSKCLIELQQTKRYKK